MKICCSPPTFPLKVTDMIFENLLLGLFWQKKQDADWGRDVLRVSHTLFNAQHNNSYWYYGGKEEEWKKGSGLPGWTHQLHLSGKRCAWVPRGFKQSHQREAKLTLHSNCCFEGWDYKFSSPPWLEKPPVFSVYTVYPTTSQQFSFALYR